VGRVLCVCEGGGDGGMGELDEGVCVGGGVLAEG